MRKRRKAYARKKILAKKRWYVQRDAESKQEYNERRRDAKKEVTKAKIREYVTSCMRGWTLR